MLLCSHSRQVAPLMTLLLSIVLRVGGFISPLLELSTQEMKVPQDIRIQWFQSWVWGEKEVMTVTMPRFTRGRPEGSDNTLAGSSMDFGDMNVSPSLIFQARWVEGTLEDVGGPYYNSHLQIRLTSGAVVTNPNLLVNITIYASNGISVYCGFPDSTAVAQQSMSTQTCPFFISSSVYTSSNLSFSKYPGMGRGCLDLDKCSKNGDCDYCLEKCACSAGYGADSDVITVGGGLDGSFPPPHPRPHSLPPSSP